LLNEIFIYKGIILEKIISFQSIKLPSQDCGNQTLNDIFNTDLGTSFGIRVDRHLTSAILVYRGTIVFWN